MHSTFEMNILVDFKGSIFTARKMRISQANVLNELRDKPGYFFSVPPDFKKGDSTFLYEIFTFIEKKAKKHNLLETSRKGLYHIFVLGEEVNYIKPYAKNYRVRYKDDFFYVEEETCSQIKITTPYRCIADKYDIHYDTIAVEIENSHPYRRWIDRSEIVEIHQVLERIGLYNSSLVIYIENETSNSFLVKTDVSDFIKLYSENHNKHDVIPSNHDPSSLPFK